MKKEELVYIPIDEKKNLLNISDEKNLSSVDREILGVIVKDIAKILPGGKGRIYIRGSLAYGRFLEGISDMDMVVVTDNITPESEKALEQLISEYNKKYADRYGIVDISYYPEDVFKDPKNNRLLMNILFTGILLYENDLCPELPTLSFSKELQKRIASQTLDDCRATLKTIENHTPVMYMDKQRGADFLCVWFMRDFCRGLIALVMNKKEVFSLNVSTCCYEFAKSFPDYEDFVLELWELERKPCNNWDTLAAVAKNALDVYEKLIKEEGIF